MEFLWSSCQTIVYIFFVFHISNLKCEDCGLAKRYCNTQFYFKHQHESGAAIADPSATKIVPGTKSFEWESQLKKTINFENLCGMKHTSDPAGTCRTQDARRHDSPSTRLWCWSLHFRIKSRVSRICVRIAGLCSQKRNNLHRILRNTRQSPILQMASKECPPPSYLDNSHQQPYIPCK